MFNSDELSAMEDEIKEMEEALQQAKAQYKEKKYSALRDAVKTRNEMDKVVQEELKKLGVSSWTNNNPIQFPFQFKF
ncbi:MAG: hypothetical protein CBC83_02255 [Flavobacteriales bacterium TMED123]|nr:hypothetical protein [Candidatus Neomarinimicrobiota bacterium]MAJ44504.1 hypothetical protein [Candidatus Neomarinimicrobiota bacterium]OUV73940.1 MAG: hypothetical protein CBC83_04700 [Flavobacteriales bacterium TMED123]OUV75581.1 MAG: hypothetical protein CBC83_02255 [Flavobacteriales bacterium TMED123]|tara:strand:+ start:618 stop:848 length:231 start_codon:yes stop_codon:yes gene_type:complete